MQSFQKTVVKLLVVLACAAGTAHGQSQTSLNVQFLGNKNDYPQSGSAGYSACWGYTAPDGREYALLGTLNGTSIIDITDAPTLREVAFIAGPPSAWREMKTYRQYAYIVTENGTHPQSGVQIVDLSNLPTSAALVKTYVWADTVGTSITRIPRAHTVSVEGKYLYLNGGNFNGIRILDLTDPLNPIKAGVYNGPYIHDSYIRNDTIYASAINNNGGLDIIDARNKVNPQRIKLLQYPGSGTHNAWTTEDGKYVLTTDEIGSTTKSLKVWDIRDIQNPVKVAEFSNSVSIVHNVVVKGNLAYVAWYADGLKVVDISNPANPQLVGYYDTYPGNPVAQYVGAWGVYPYFPSGKVIVSDMQSGLYVLRYTPPNPQSQNVQLLGNYQGRKERNPQGTYYSSVWGYTDVNGREYGILGTYRGTAIVDLSYLPDSLHEVAFIPGPTAAYSYREFKTYLHYLYIVSEGGNGVQIVDLAGLPNSVRMVGSYQTSTFDRAHTISETAGYLYVNGGNATVGGKDIGGTLILSLANPEQPVEVGKFAEHYVHDSYTRRDTLFASGIFGHGLSIVDVRNKANPVLLKTIQYPGSGTHNAWTTDDGRYVLTTDEIGSTPKTLKIWDIRDLNAVEKVGEWNPRPNDIIHNVCVKGNYAYIAYYKAGLLIADISNPRSPTLAGYYDTYPDTNTTLYNGAWGVYPYFPSGRILISDMMTGLYVFRFDEQKIGSIAGTVTDAYTNQPIANALVRVVETGQTRWTNAQGQFLWGYATGNYTLQIEKTGYQTQTAETTIQQNMTTTLAVSLTPAMPPGSFMLYQNYPNPFNPMTTIVFDLPREAPATLKLFTTLGQEIRVITQGTFSAGRHRVQLDASDLPSGVYIYRLETTGYTDARRMVVLH
ncbi:MAG TPA: choice-of-anchor B family protein [Bacteroidota bacterium]|nr:choice-of-anchor B family protein [Bacteroidota bacterium]